MALTDEQKLFGDWLSLPKGMREPTSQAKFADMIGVNGTTLTRWKKLPTMKAYVDDTHMLKMRDRLGELHEALVEHAIAGKHPRYMEMALQVALEQFGNKEVDVRITTNESRKMTTEQIADGMFKILKRNGVEGISKANFRKAVESQSVGDN